MITFQQYIARPCYLWLILVLTLLFGQSEMMYRKNPKLLNQFQYSEKEGIPLIVLIGEEEKANGGVKIRDVETRKEVGLFHIQHVASGR